MDRLFKRTEHPVSPILQAPKKLKVSPKQGVISASFRAQKFGVHFYESGGKRFFAKVATWLSTTIGSL